MVTVAFDSKMGNMVKLDHGYGIVDRVRPLGEISGEGRSAGQTGDVVALVGSTGLSTGPHLHYMVKKNGQSLDPTKFILD
ncbi:MAG: M23 family metallopeptidase [Nitrospira sp.]|nr:M23 family metallopeptidase [Nitrospira sp.]